MKIELHVLQNFAPSNLNRDDTGSPKDAEFGGFRRARISSQCLKRAVRTEMRGSELLPADMFGTRTKRLRDYLVGQFVKADKSHEQAKSVAATACEAAGIPLDDRGQSKYLLFLGTGALTTLATACLAHWDVLVSAAAQAKLTPAKGGAPKAKKAKGKDGHDWPVDLEEAFAGVFNAERAVDVAMFGRMVADAADQKVDAACQVAHALSTNRMSLEFDYFTAVDDLQPNEESGAGMIGTVEFNSACFYRYSNLDLTQLARNLGADEQLASSAAQAFVEASVHAIPTGKQSSMAALNPPSLVLVVTRKRGAASLANAFVDPVRPAAGRDLVGESVRRLDEYWVRLNRMYGSDDVMGAWVCALDDHASLTMVATAAGPAVTKCDSVAEVFASVRDAARQSFKRAQ